MARLMDHSEAIVPNATPNVKIYRPDMAQSNMMFITTLCGPPRQPDDRWYAKDKATWDFMWERLHLGHFVNIADVPADIPQTFKAHKKSPDPETTCATATMWAIDDAAGDLGWTGQHVCEDAGDGVCNGKWKGNTPASTTFETGSKNLPCPSMRVEEGDLLLFTASCHDNAHPITPPDGFEQLVSIRNAKMTFMQAWRFASADGDTGILTAQPSEPGWEHGIVSLIAIR